MRATTRGLLLIFSLISFAAISNANHIIGGHMSYEVVSLNDGVFEVKLDVEIYRDNNAEGQFDSSMRLGLFGVTNSGPFELLDVKESVLGQFSETNEIVIGNCISTIPATQIGEYSFLFNIPSDGRDYHIVYQRCCRANSIINVQDPEESGIPLHLILTSEGLQFMNKSHKLISPMDRYLVVNETNNLTIKLTENVNQYSTEFIRPFTTGGTSGNLNSCQGIKPDPQWCPPPFFNVSLESNVSSESLFFENDDFEKVSDLEYSVLPRSEGVFLIAYYIHEYQDSVLLSSHYREQLYSVSECDIVLDNKELELGLNMILYPNPVDDFLQIKSNRSEMFDLVVIVDVQGKEIFRLEGKQINTLDVSNFVPGLYFVRLQNGDRLEVSKFIKS